MSVASVEKEPPPNLGTVFVQIILLSNTTSQINKCIIHFPVSISKRIRLSSTKIKAFACQHFSQITPERFLSLFKRNVYGRKF